jgi:hypothetical protein
MLADSCPALRKGERVLLEKLGSNVASAMDHSANLHAVALRGVENDVRLKAKAAQAFPQFVGTLADSRKVC